MTLAEMDKAAAGLLDDAAGQNSGDSPSAALQGAALVASTLWRVGREICARLDRAQESADRSVKSRIAAAALAERRTP